MNLMEKYGPEATKLSIGQYCPPKCFELAGKKFDICIDTGDVTGDAILNFIDGTKVEWSIKSSGILAADEYECRKADDYTYLVTYCVEGKLPRENHTWILDLEQGLVTLLHAALGENPKWPYLIESDFGFGYIVEEGKEPGLKRHGFSDDVVGTSAKWVYGHELATVHVYHHSNWYRITYPKDRVITEAARAQNEAFREIIKAMPSSDEPAYYIKIKEGMYLVSVTEQNMEKLLGDKIRFRSNTLCFLDNWHRLYGVGRGFGTGTQDGVDNPIYVMIGRYGLPEEVSESFFTDPIPYLV